MSTARGRLERLKRETRFNPLPLPPSLEQAFQQIENLDAMHPSSRGQSFGSIIRPTGNENRTRAC